MIFGYFTLLVALVISAVAAYYSIVGLTAIFAAAVIPIIIMGAALEVGKITAAVWLKINWTRASWTYKLYLVPAVAFLMVLTSMGIFGFLSKAHSDQSLVSGDVQSKIAIYDEKIKTARENIEANRRQLKQMDEAVDQVMARSTSEQGADKANAIRRSQQRDRVALAKDIEANQRLITTLNDEAAPIRAEVRKVEAEVGPIKYIAALVYGDNPDANLLEAAVRWVIILIVAVFDPLALVLILAAQQSIRWAKEDKEEKTEGYPAYIYDNFEKPTAEELADEEEPGPAAPANDSILEKHPYLFKGDFWKKPEGWVDVGPIVANTAPTVNSANVQVNHAHIPDDVTDSEPEPTPASKDDGIRVKKLEGDYFEVNDKKYSKEVFYKLYPELVRKVEADNVVSVQAKSGFGTKYPEAPQKGDFFLRVDYLPNKLFKFNGFKWIEVDKDKTDSYSYNDQYIQYLIEKLQSGEYEIDQLSATEQELVAAKLQNK